MSHVMDLFLVGQPHSTSTSPQPRTLMPRAVPIIFHADLD
jgi:hypothetical protein